MGGEGNAALDIQGWDSGGGKTSHATENGGGCQGLSAGGVQDGNMLYDHDEARESGWGRVRWWKDAMVGGVVLWRWDAVCGGFG